MRAAQLECQRLHIQTQDGYGQASIGGLARGWPDQAIGPWLSIGGAADDGPVVECDS